MITSEVYLATTWMIPVSSNCNFYASGSKTQWIMLISDADILATLTGHSNRYHYVDDGALA